MRQRMALTVALALAAVAGFALLVAGASGFFTADARPEAAPASAPGELVQFMTATPAPSVPDASMEHPPVVARGDDDDWWEEEHERGERGHREDDDEHDEHEAHERGEWEREDDD